MTVSAAAILGQLKAVEAERQRRAALPELNARVVALKQYQQRRFAHTYADLLLSARYAAAARYFLEELYGPKDFSRRDDQFARVAPTVARLFPDELAETVETLAELHALSEILDTEMGALLPGERIEGVDYIRAWRGVGRAPDRARQIELTLGIAARLDRITRLPLVRHSLRLMRRPASAAGLAELQRALEIGFDSFGQMNGAQEFIAIIGARERDFAAALFASAPDDIDDLASIERALANLPAA
jgi:hypothetical protein